MSESKLQALLSEAKLHEDLLIPSDQDEYVQCPLNPTHRVCKRFYEEHMVSIEVVFLSYSGMCIITTQSKT